MSINKISNWINELADDTPTRFSEFFYDDIRNYLNLDEINSNNIESSLKEICGTKFNELEKCNSKEDVKKWLDKISGDIIMNLETDSIIYKYFH